MLVLSRKVGETIYIDEHIKITVIGVAGNRTKIGIDAPLDVAIVRGELNVWNDVAPQLEGTPDAVEEAAV